MEPPLLELAGLAKRYGDFTAVDGVSLALGPGELVALLGPNGAGKTTTIRMLMGLLKPSGGTARIAGRDCFADRAEVMREVGYLPDEPVYHDYLTGRELIRFVASVRGLADTATAADALAARLDIAKDLDEYAVNYSKGMKKKLGLVLALLHRPRLLILDEPTNGLDPYATRELHQLMRERAADGTAVLYSTHLLDQVEKLGGRAAIMAKGRVAAEGGVAELRARLSGDRSLEEAFFAVTGGAAGAEDATGTEGGAAT